MPSRTIPLITGETYHVYNRGVDKRNIFLDKYDYERFYKTLSSFSVEHPTDGLREIAEQSKAVVTQRRLVDIHSYCLLPNHFHLLLTQTIDGGLSEFMKRISVGYTGYFNEKNKRSGALFQGKYKRVFIESDMQYQYLFAYVNENHSVHNLPIAKDISQSSSLHYQGKKISHMIQTELDAGYYACEEHRQLAKDISKRRSDTKKFELLE